jgi:hypothetical protein
MGSSTGIMAESRFPRQADLPVVERVGGARPRGAGRRRRGSLAQAVLVPAAASRPSSSTEVSRILNFCTLPVTVMGKASTNFQ